MESYNNSLRVREKDSAVSLGKKEREKILDVKGAWVMPGLIEAHAHIVFHYYRSSGILDPVSSPMCRFGSQARTFHGRRFKSDKR